VTGAVDFLDLELAEEVSRLLIKIGKNYKDKRMMNVSSG